MAHQQSVTDSFDQLIRLPPLTVLLQFENTPVKLSVLCRYDRRQGRLWVCVASDGNGGSILRARGYANAYGTAENRGQSECPPDGDRNHESNCPITSGIQ